MLEFVDRFEVEAGGLVVAEQQSPLFQGVAGPRGIDLQHDARTTECPWRTLADPVSRAWGILHYYRRRPRDSHRAS